MTEVKFPVTEQDWIFNILLHDETIISDLLLITGRQRLACLETLNPVVRPQDISQICD